jgi:NADPH-dependent 2,4-dienoyl-CoA reductase/sulfur reductase-like enzyme
MMINDGTIYGLENIEKRREKYSLIGHDIVVDTDVCVIGSGEAGAILGEELANGGSDGPDNSRSVVILEKGGYYDAEDMNQEK